MTGKLRMGVAQFMPPATTQPTKPLSLVPSSHSLLALRRVAANDSPNLATPKASKAREGPARTYTPVGDATVQAISPCAGGAVGTIVGAVAATVGVGTTVAVSAVGEGVAVVVGSASGVEVDVARAVGVPVGAVVGVWVAVGVGVELGVEVATASLSGNTLLARIARVSIEPSQLTDELMIQPA